MKRLLCGAAVAAASLLSAIPSSAQAVVTMSATLTGGEETPAPGVNTGAVGTALVSVDSVNEELAVTLSLFNLPTGTSAGHIHIAPKGLAGPVVINFPIPTGRTGDLPLTFRVGAAAFVSRPDIGIVTMADAIQSIVGGNAYVNIHTSQNPAGEIRGQLSVLK
jgi:CHRD domain